MWRTPWPVAGCNRPAGPCAEQTVGVGWNGKGGTRSEVGSLRAEERSRTWHLGSGRAGLVSAEGRSLMNPKRGIRTGATASAEAKDKERVNRNVSLKERHGSRELSSDHSHDQARRIGIGEPARQRSC
jgi:hypothetical protein